MIKRALLALLLICPVVYAQERGAEITTKRTYNQKVFELPDGKKEYKIHIGQIHYKDGAEFKEIDTTLSRNIFTGNWSHTKASWHSGIPEYADEWFEFVNVYEGNNSTILARPVAAHVQGQLVTTGPWANKQVLYPDAFGKGIDLLVTARNHGILKEVIVNKKPAQVTDLTFDFEVQLPQSEDEWRSAKRGTTITAKAAMEDLSGDDIRIGKSQFSYSRRALMWDSDPLTPSESVKLELYTSDGKTFLRKTLPAAFLEQATYPVYTDHPTDYYAGAGDGAVFMAGASWDTVHDAATGNSANYTNANTYWQFYKFSTTWYSSRLFFPIDTSGIDDGETVTAAILKLYGNAIIGFWTVNAYDYAVVVNTSQASTSTLATADYDQCGAIDSPTEGSDHVVLSTFNGAYRDFTLNATGLGWINKTGVSMLGARHGGDVEDIDPDGLGVSYRYVSTSEYTGTDQDPYLSVTTSAGGSEEIMEWFTN